MCEVKKLSCGGKGPCCHVGYSHRHCEHCDVVIDLRSQFSWPYFNPPYAPTTRPYITLGNGTLAPNSALPMPQPPTVYAMNSGTASGTLYMEGVKALAEHACEVNP